MSVDQQTINRLIRCFKSDIKDIENKMNKCNDDKLRDKMQKDIDIFDAICYDLKHDLYNTDEIIELIEDPYIPRYLEPSDDDNDNIEVTEDGDVIIH
ncbi:hypothetical protein M9Y10_037497 [Tritrichomonas musculus]|uniref:Uncharacterized protein n=2 Tax=Tritrichomonas musculus TaxID=1915356 RepID=A0ABR2GRJ6_9EUKA